MWEASLRNEAAHVVAALGLDHGARLPAELRTLVALHRLRFLVASGNEVGVWGLWTRHPDSLVATGHRVRVNTLLSDMRLIRAPWRERITDAAVLPDGRVATCSPSTAIYVHDVPVLRPLQLELPSAQSGIVAGSSVFRSSMCHAVFPLASFGTDGRSYRLVGHQDFVRCLCVLPDGRLVSGSDDGALLLWRVPPPVSLARGPISASPVQVKPDGRIASPDGHSPSSWIACCAYDPVLKLVLSGADDFALVAWRLPDVAQHRTASKSSAMHADLDVQVYGAFRDHAGPVSCIAVVPTGRAVTASVDEHLRLIDLASMTVLAKVACASQRGFSHVIAPAVDLIVLAPVASRHIIVWRTAGCGDAETPVFVPVPAASDDDAVSCIGRVSQDVAPSPTAGPVIIAVGMRAGTCLLLDLASGKVVRTLPACRDVPTACVARVVPYLPLGAGFAYGAAGPSAAVAPVPTDPSSPAGIPELAQHPPAWSSARYPKTSVLSSYLTR